MKNPLQSTALIISSLFLIPSLMADDRRKDGGSKLTRSEIRAMVDYHNKVRSEVGVGEVRWSDDIAAFAQEWADHIAKTGEFEHRPPKSGEPRYGENLAAGSGGGYGVVDGAIGWYEEKEFYEPGMKIPEDFSDFKAGHYTQMVWDKSTRIGAGKAVITTGELKGWIVIVCNYDPPGNQVGATPYRARR